MPNFLPTPLKSPQTPRPAPLRLAGPVGWGRRWRAWVLAWSLLFMMAQGKSWAAEAQPVSEYELKAAFLPKFPLFVEWPASAFTASGGPLIIGVLGGNPFGEHLEKAVQGKIIGGHPLRWQMCRDLEEAARCHIVFLAGAAVKKLDETLRQLADHPVLLVSDTPGFASQGGMVNMIAAQQKVRLEVNLEAVQRANLRMNPQFLQSAKIVKPASPKP